MGAQVDTEQNTAEQLLSEWAQEYRRVESELREIELLTQQISAELERLTHRNIQVTNRVRQVEAMIDTVPRTDIKEAYTAMLETQQRLFTMRGQLEKLQSDREKLRRYQELLRRVNQLISERRPDSAPAESSEEEHPVVVRIIEAQEHERKRLSRQMHDGPAQALTNLILQAEICERLFAVDPVRARQELANLKQTAGMTFQKVRNFILNLRPMMLDDLGLVPALRRFVDSFAENSGMQVQFVFTGKERRFAPHKEVTVFRSLQELLNTAHDVGHATTAQIHLDLGEEQVRCSFEDNGTGYSEVVGLDAEQLGLTLARERVEMLGGQFHLEFIDGQGLRAVLEFPAQ